MIPLISPVIGFNDIFACYRHKNRPIDRPGILAREFGKKYCLFVSEGREALAMALENLQLKKNDEIIVPSYVCDIVPKVVEQFATVVYADINPSTIIVDAEEIKNLISKRTKAVIVAYMYGKAVNISKIHDVCKANNIALIEDCAQAICSYEGDTRAGSIGDYTILSFRFSKDVGLNKGGALLTNKSVSIIQKRGSSLIALAKILLVQIALRSQYLFLGSIYYYIKEFLLNPYFSMTKYTPKKVKHELSTFEQELVLEGVRKMPEFIDKKNKNAVFYASCLKDIDGIELCDMNDNSFMRFNVLALNREGLIKTLHRNGVECDKMYSYCMSQECKQSLLISQKIVNLPVHPEVSTKDMEKICSKIRQYFT
jgi:dTDP-4-amino-4,6-dideoxygalactose transaminase